VESPPSDVRGPIHTIGHGNRPLEELETLLRSSRVACLVDVRAFPGSRRHPQFGRAELERTMPEAGIRYIWEGKALGGRRRPHPDSPHIAMRNDSFRAYADHMQSEEFAAGVERLLEIAAAEGVAIMCAERLPWQCHRYMISDFLVARGVEVLHVIDAKQPKPHRLRAEARVTAGGLIYDLNAQPDLGLDK
jgi:uncharacterized protein (DUF488 family)